MKTLKITNFENKSFHAVASLATSVELLYFAKSKPNLMLQIQMGGGEKNQEAENLMPMSLYHPLKCLSMYCEAGLAHTCLLPRPSPQVILKELPPFPHVDKSPARGSGPAASRGGEGKSDRGIFRGTGRGTVSLEDGKLWGS
jgi:hypothetical protein